MYNYDEYETRDLWALLEHYEYWSFEGDTMEEEHEEFIGRYSAIREVLHDRGEL